MKRLQIEQPKAKVIYDIEDSRILITYPLPRDIFFQPTHLSREEWEEEMRHEIDKTQDE